MRLDDNVILRWCMLAQVRVRTLIHSLSALIATVLLLMLLHFFLFQPLSSSNTGITSLVSALMDVPWMNAI